jgi:hypothetical protein
VFNDVLYTLRPCECTCIIGRDVYLLHVQFKGKVVVSNYNATVWNISYVSFWNGLISFSSEILFA